MATRVPLSVQFRAGALQLLAAATARRELRAIDEEAQPYLPANVSLDTEHHFRDRAGRRLGFDLIRPATTDSPLPGIIWVHGGGWVAGDRRGTRSFLRVLAAHGFSIVNVDYTLAPRAIFPTQPQQVADALAHVIANATELGIDANRLVIAGDSAGAHIAACVATAISNPAYGERVGITLPGGAQIAAAVLFCGPYFLRRIASGNARTDAFANLLLSALLGCPTDALPRGGEGHLAAVGEHVTAGFPPAFVSTGNADPLLPDSVRLVDRLSELDSPVTSHLFAPDREPALPHEYQNHLALPEARTALVAVAEFLHRVLD